MLLARSLRCRSDRRLWRRALPFALAVGLASLAACNPVESWRNLTGASKNDPDPKTTANTKNLEAGAEKPYPNLATVPPPPTGGLTEAQLEKLTKSLAADREHAQYSNEQLRGGFAAGPPPPAPEPAVAAAPASVSAAPQSAAAGRAAGAAAAPVERAAAAPAERVVATPAEQVAAAPAGAGPAAPAAPAKAGKLPSGRRKPGEPPEAGPMESSLTMPPMASMPPPDAAQPAPPPPHLPAPQTAPAAPGTLASLPPPSAGYEAPPPALQMAAPKPPGAAAVKPAKPVPKEGMRLAAVVFPSQSTALSGYDQQQLAAIVPFYKTHPGLIRVVGYAGEAGGSALAQLNSFSAALDRAQAVAAVLAKAGIPAAKIKVEAAPAGAALGPPRAEVLLVPSG